LKTIAQRRRTWQRRKSVSTQDASKEPPSSPLPPSASDDITRKLPEDTMNEAASAGMPRCPRCGGHAAPRRRAPSRLNPFLRSAPPSGQITCDDCGLDFEHAADSNKAPWSTKET
jgi:hypothetical protein